MKRRSVKILLTACLAITVSAAAAACGTTESVENVGDFTADRTENVCNGKMLTLNSGEPDVSLGEEGDICLVAETGTLYRKSAKGWAATEFTSYNASGSTLTVTYTDGSVGTYDLASMSGDCTHETLGEPQTIYPAKCVIPGIAVRYCPDCKTSFPAILPATGEHTYLSDGITCSGCGEAHVNGVESLQSLSDAVKSGKKFEGETVYLDAPVDLSGVAWTPIGGTSSFSGTFEGNHQTISNLNAPLFGGVGSGATAGTVKDLTLNVTGNGRLADKLTANSLIENVTVTGETSLTEAGPTTETFYCGAFAAYSYQARFVDCDNQASVSSVSVSAGYVGRANGSCSFTNCKNSGEIYANAGSGAKACGFIGVVGSYVTIDFTDCVNYGDCTVEGGVEMYAAGFAGWVADGETNSTVNAVNCKNYGAISGIRTVTGGSTVAVGGILATVWHASANLTNVENHGTVSADNRSDGHNAHIGGIIGMCNPNAVVDINGVVSDGALVGKISNTANTGGVCNIGGVIGQTNSVTSIRIHGKILLTEKMTITTEQVNGKAPNQDALIGSHGSANITVDVTELVNLSDERTFYQA